MKVLIIDVNCKHSSTGKIVYDLYTQLKNSSHEVRVCYGRGSLIKEPEIYKFSSNSEMYVHALLTRLTGLTGVYSPFATRKLIKLIEEFKPDVVHIHELHAYFVNIAHVVKYLKLKKIRTIWTFHCEFMYTGKCGYAYECEKWKSGCHKCPQIREYPASLLFDFTKKMFQIKKEIFEGFDNLTIITPSKWLADRVRMSFLRNKEIKVIYNGIDTNNIFYPMPYDHLKIKHNLADPKIVLAVAPDIMSKRKGGKWVVELAKRFHGNNVVFILIGVADTNQIFDSNIIPLGRTTNQLELAEYYSMADITVLTSEKETFSLVCAESLACGTPIIGFEAGAPTEIVPNGYGLFVPYGNIDLLYKSTKDVLDGKIKLANQDQCTMYCKSNFDKSIMLYNYISLYNQK